jgi:DNA-binding NarL/FixJ family response regulator
MAKYPKIRILMLSLYHQAEIVMPCIESGVHGYMLKNENDFDIYIAVRLVIDKGYYFSPEIASLLASNARLRKAMHIILNKREREVLDLLFIGKTAKDIAAKLGNSKSTVDNIRNKMLEKFGVKNSPELIFKALQKVFLKVDIQLT